MTAALIRLFKAEIVKFNKKSDNDGEGSPAPPPNIDRARDAHEEPPEVLAHAEWEQRRALYQLTALPYL